jgi:hypothetical protein
MGESLRDKPVPLEIATLPGGDRLILRETTRAVTAFGGVAVWVAYLRKSDLVAAVCKHGPVSWRLPNQIDPAATFTAFLLAVLVGARRFAHANWLRGDEALRQLLRLVRLPTDDTIRNLCNQFSMGHVQRFLLPLAEWQMERLPRREGGYNRRAGTENRIAELKHDLGADRFRMKRFQATEAASRTFLLLFNLQSEFQRAAGLSG